MVMDWNLVTNDWEKDVPYFFKSKYYLLKWATIYLYSKKYLKNLILSSFLYKFFPIKRNVELHVCQNDWEKWKQDFLQFETLDETTYKIIINIPVKSSVKLDVGSLGHFIESTIANNINDSLDGYILKRSLITNKLNEFEKDFDGVLKKLNQAINVKLQNSFVDEIRRRSDSLCKVLGFSHVVDINELVLQFKQFFEVTYAYFLMRPATGIDQMEGVLYLPGKGFLVNDKSLLEESGGGFHLEYSSETYYDEKALISLATLWFREYSISDWAEKVKIETIRHALRSAIAAIMARNMDHLLGSHIETAIAYQMPDLRRELHRIAIENGISALPSPTTIAENVYEDDYWAQSIAEEINDETSRKFNMRVKMDELIRGLEREYSNYRLRRMDLIARFSTEWVPWSSGTSFFFQVLHSFLRNGILQHFLGHGEGIHLSDLDIQLFYPEPNCLECKQQNCDFHRVRAFKGSSEGFQGKTAEMRFHSLPLSASSEVQFEFSTPAQDFMNIRGGDIGTHAFHILLENILRNSAKHGKLSDSPKIMLRIWAIQRDACEILNALTFTPTREDFAQALKESNDLFWFVLISSSADYKDSDALTELLSATIDGYLCKPLINDAGDTDSEAWGMKEKKICAAYLSGGGPEDANSNNPMYLWAGTMRWYDGRKRLSYCLKIPKSRFLVFIKNDRDGRRPVDNES
jgi:hypothetical protein